jgi:hypothetical protein
MKTTKQVLRDKRRILKVVRSERKAIEAFEARVTKLLKKASDKQSLAGVMSDIENDPYFDRNTIYRSLENISIPYF